MFAQQRKKHEYDFSLRGYLINWMLIVCSSIGLVSFLYASYANTLFSPIFYLGLPLFIAIPFLITFIVLSSQNLLMWKKLKGVDPNKCSMDNYNNTYKKVTLSFMFSLIYSVYSSLFVFSFVTLGQYYDIINKIDLKHILASFVLQIILIVVSIIVAIVLIKKIINKDFNKSKLNSFIAIGTLATSCVSLMICGLTFGLLFSMYNFLETIIFWIPFMVNLFVILVLVVISLIYLIKCSKSLQNPLLF
jgi:hypothetical protein